MKFLSSDLGKFRSEINPSFRKIVSSINKKFSFDDKFIFSDSIEEISLFKIENQNSFLVAFPHGRIYFCFPIIKCPEYSKIAYNIKNKSQKYSRDYFGMFCISEPFISASSFDGRTINKIFELGFDGDGICEYNISLGFLEKCSLETISAYYLIFHSLNENSDSFISSIYNKLFDGKKVFNIIQKCYDTIQEEKKMIEQEELVVNTTDSNKIKV